MQKCNGDGAKLPVWARQKIQDLESKIKRLEEMQPWTEHGMEWYSARVDSTRYRSIFVCDTDGTHLIASLSPYDKIFVGRGNPPPFK